VEKANEMIMENRDSQCEVAPTAALSVNAWPFCHLSIFRWFWDTHSFWRPLLNFSTFGVWSCPDRA